MSISAHAHADALSVEVRHRGVDILADPGTYCYQGLPPWRSYFRSTSAHNTLSVDGQDQSESQGPFLWGRQARTEVLDVSVDGSGRRRWAAQHDGYASLAQPAQHRRTVTLDPDRGTLEILDDLQSEGAHLVQMAFHLGPTVDIVLDGHQAQLEWKSPESQCERALLSLPPDLEWSAHRGETDPILGWYAPAYGRKEPTTTLIGRGTVATATFPTTLSFLSRPEGVSGRPTGA